MTRNKIGIGQQLKKLNSFMETSTRILEEMNRRQENGSSYQKQKKREHHLENLMTRKRGEAQMDMDKGVPEGALTYYRLMDPREFLISNPIFVRYNPASTAH